MTLLQQTNSGIETKQFKVLYIGSDPEPVENILSRVEKTVGMRAVSGVAQAMKVVRTTPVDCVIVDQRHESNQAALLTAALAGDPNVKQIIVMTTPENAAAYEALGAKCQVLFYPVQPVVLLDAILVDRGSKNRKWQPRKLFSQLRQNFPPAAIPRLNFARHMIPLVSFVYKNTALVLLAALFSVFVSYGAMIVFYLGSSNWAAPLTLSAGHELVTKTQRQISDLQVKGNLVSQRISKENRESDQAQRRYDDAGVLANYVAGTLDQEVEQRLVRQKDTQVQIQTLAGLLRNIKKALGKQGAPGRLRNQFKRRLINRKVYTSSQLAILELQQRKANIQSEIASLKRQVSETADSILMLESMRQQIQRPEIKSIVAASTQFVPLADQVISVKTTLNNAKVQLASHAERLVLLNKNAKIINQEISAIAATPLARAAIEPVVVLFVPYENAKSFKPGAPLYACRFGIIWCRKIGETAKPVAGEVVSVHPFFGKNIRGSFVEAILTDQEAAKKEVLHVGRPPLLF